jgi:nephron
MTYENGTSYLHIIDAQRDDIGHFRCIADNRVANPISRDVLLIVKCELGRVSWVVSC